jgi:periplasmic protein CpxP/Spy
MKTWIKRTLVGAASVIGLAALFGALSGCGHHSGRHHHASGWSAMSDEDAAKLKARFVERAGSKLDLDEAQKAKLAVLADRLREQHTALVAGGGADPRADPRAEWRSLFAGATFDRSKAEALVSSKTGAVQAKSPAVITALGDFYDSLKPEQQAKVREFMSRGRHGRRG